MNAKVRESSIAIDLEKIQNNYSEVDIGSYPYSKESSFGTIIVIRGVDEINIQNCKKEVEAMLDKLKTT